MREQVPVSKDRPSLHGHVLLQVSTPYLYSKKKKTASDFTSASIRFVKNGTGFPDWNVANYINGLGYLLDLPLKSCLVSHSISRESFAVHDLLKLLRSCLRKVPS